MKIHYVNKIQLRDIRKKGVNMVKRLLYVAKVEPEKDV